MKQTTISETIIAIVQEHAFKLIEEKIPQAANYLQMIDDDDPTIGYVGDGFMEGRELKDLGLPEKLEDDMIEVHSFEKYLDPNFIPDPNEPEIKDNPCLKFKIRVK